MKRYALCPYCGNKRVIIEYAGRLREHLRPDGVNLCANYDQFLRPIVNPPAAEVIELARHPKVTP